MRRAFLLLSVAVVSAGLAACSSAPELLQANSKGIAIRLADDGDKAMAEAVDIANRHCVNARRLAVLQNVAEVDGERLAFFECVEV